MPVNTMVYRHSISFDLALSRDDWIRTSGPFVPNEVRYRAALHPEKLNSKSKEDDSLLQIKIH